VSKRLFTSARFCPWCGTETLERDEYQREHGRVSRDGRPAYEFGIPEYVCRICGAGFKLGPSMRHAHAVALFAEHRKMRPPVENELGEKI